VFEPSEPTKEPVAIIGSGPAGLSCGAELARQGYPVTIFERMDEPGGVLRYGVPSYRFSKDYLKEELQDIIDLGVKFECNHPISQAGEAEALLNKGFDAVFIATGLWDAVSIFDNKPKGVYNSVAFLSSPHSNPPDLMQDQIKGKRVAVIGGGSVAMDCAGFAQTLGAQNVYLIYRRSFNQMPAETDERVESLENDVHFLILNQPKAYVTDPSGRLTGITLARTLAPARRDERRTPVEVEDSQWTLEIDLVVEAIGNKAFDDSDKAYPGVNVNDKKLIAASPTDCKTSKEGIFAGGDIVRGPSLVVHAVQDGKTAAANIDRYLQQRRDSNE
jgi:glutamate synthase (NADPH) small chain